MNWKRLVLGLLGLAVLAAVILFFVLRPQVLAAGPEMSAGDVSRFTPVEITFSREMRPETVEEALAISPEIKGEFSWEGQTVRFTPSDGWPAGAEVEVHLERDARSRLGLKLGEASGWTFKVSPVLLAYLWPSKGNANIYLLDIEEGGVRQLTDTGGVLSYSISPDGLVFYYFAENNQGGSDLYQLDRYLGQAERLLTCQRALCSEAAVSPDGSRLAYLRNDSEVWVLPLDGKGEEQRVSSATETARFPLWAAEDVLSYYDAGGQEFVVFDLTAEDVIETWPNQSGELGDWSPTGDRFVAPEFFEIQTDLLRGPTGERSNQEAVESELEPVWVASSQLQLYTVGSRQAAGLSEEDMAEDYAPAYSPDGTRLVFTRRYLDEERWTPGRQVWLMAAGTGSGSQRRQLTDAPDYEYSALTWHPDGERIAAVRFDVTLLTGAPEVWLLELSGGGLRLVYDGYAPQWVP